MNVEEKNVCLMTTADHERDEFIRRHCNALGSRGRKVFMLPRDFNEILIIVKRNETKRKVLYFVVQLRKANQVSGRMFCV